MLASDDGNHILTVASEDYPEAEVMDRKAPKSEGNLNADICEALIELAVWEKNVNRNQHKHNAYRKAAQAVSSLDYRLESGKEAKKLPGVGEKIAQKIDEILETGKLKKLDTIRSDDTSLAVNSLTRVAGIGPAKARELYEEGITTIEELKEHTDKLTKSQKIGLKYVDEFEQRIPRSEIKQLEHKIRKRVNKLDKKYVMTVCGSYRREAESSGDVDILLTHPSFVVEDAEDSEDNEREARSQGKKAGHLLRAVVSDLEDADIVTDTLSQGETKVSTNQKQNFGLINLHIFSNIFSLWEFASYFLILCPEDLTSGLYPTTSITVVSSISPVATSSTRTCEAGPWIGASPLMSTA